VEFTAIPICAFCNKSVALATAQLRKGCSLKDRRTHYQRTLTPKVTTVAVIPC
jgi:hypothetical protein